ncbi:NAD(P)H-quinone oxidoreductase [Methylacidiphilum caldifontis]|uniref:NADPH:quinone reductase n=1 Tax=Methylacidiphilum caldifontis TaxID=2795386 RepID=A0A4Y8PF86_9BACT|nr:NAD(P)H-quinone oxidoreductase [Methylacidiphilum caldifontis]QSR88393.1 NAD(P)H-quinone oxidoreductase [Methylacidiphilum caldifontis]TFE70692.1 NADPH:quinone reductase [Methylacidiphilum caldifontis]
MRSCWIIEEENKHRKLKPVCLPSLHPGRAELKIDVYYAGINRADLLQLQGVYPQPGPAVPYEIPGLEFSGIISEVGLEVQSWKEGDQVFGLVIGGAFSSEIIVHERMALAVSGKLSLMEAAAIPETFFTAWDGLEYRLKAKENETLLISAAGSGVGLSALALARIKNLKPFCTVRTPSKKNRLLEVGALDVVVAEEQNLVEWALSRTEGKGMDMIFDLVGGANFSLYLSLVAERGRILCLGLLGGTKTEISLELLLRKRLTLVGSTLRSRPIEEKICLTQDFRRKILPYFINGELKPVIDQVFPWDQLPQALSVLKANKNFGKLLLKVR